MGITLAGLVGVSFWFGLEKLIDYRSKPEEDKIIIIRDTATDDITTMTELKSLMLRRSATRNMRTSVLPTTSAAVPTQQIAMTLQWSRRQLTPRMQEVLHDMTSLQLLRMRQTKADNWIDDIDGEDMSLLRGLSGAKLREPPKVDLKTLEVSLEAIAHRAAIKHVRFSPDGSSLATSSEDRTSVIYSVKVCIFQRAGAIQRIYLVL
jgi:WD40 repeat protein